jgi:hypothetical protein
MASADYFFYFSSFSYFLASFSLSFESLYSYLLKFSSPFYPFS